MPSKRVKKLTDRKHRYITPYTPHWERLANRTARTWVDVLPCANCGAPLVGGYCCGRCGCSCGERKRCSCAE